MNPKRPNKRNQAESVFWRASCVMRQLIKDEAGVTAIEYALLASLIAMIASVGIALLGGGLSGMWTDISQRLIAVL